MGDGRPRYLAGSHQHLACLLQEVEDIVSLSPDRILLHAQLRPLGAYHDNPMLLT